MHLLPASERIHSQRGTVLDARRCWPYDPLPLPTNQKDEVPKMAQERAPVSRRAALKIAGSAAAAAVVTPRASSTASGAAEASQEPVRTSSGRTKRVIVAGGGIAGLSCAYELMKRGHDVTVLEAAGHTGGHVRTFRDPSPTACMWTAGPSTSRSRDTRSSAPT
jgi:NADPH-dependent 2,4-dienoyl-CoA reductase/sulfur reductase-like enzyme